MKIATIILNYNSSEDCKKCIGFLQQQQGVEQEIIVVDNCSCNRERENIEKFCNTNGLTFIANKVNNGYNAGNNIGLRHAAQKGYEYALIANPDMEFPQRDYLMKLLEPMIADKDIVVCGSDIVTLDGTHQNPKNRRRDHLSGYFQWIRRRTNTKEKTNPDWIESPYESNECSCLNGCCLCVQMDFIKEIDFFDENTFLYGEEPILGAQVEENKKKMYYTAQTSAIHNHKKSNEGNRAFCLKHWRHSMLHYLYRYSKMPLYKKICAQTSIELYFIVLRFTYMLKQIKKRFHLWKIIRQKNY